MNNDSKSSQNPKQPFQDPNKRNSSNSNQKGNEPSQPIYSPEEASRQSSNELGKTYSNDPSQYASKSAEPGRTQQSRAGEKETSYSGPSRTGNDQKEKEYAQKESMEDKVRDSFRNIRDSKKVDQIYDYAKNNIGDTITYVLLAVGLLLLLFLYESILGELIIGGVAGYHFAPQIMYYLRNIGQLFNGQDQLRYVVLTVVILGLFIDAPGIFIGALIVAAFRQFFLIKEERKSEEIKPKNNPNAKNNGSKNR